MGNFLRNIFSSGEKNSLGTIVKDVVGGIKDISENEIESYLERKYTEYMPDKSHDEIVSNISEIMTTIRTNDQNLRELEQAKEKGINREAWFEEKTRAAFEEAGLATAATVYESCSEALQTVNESMYNTLQGNSSLIPDDKVIDINQYEIKDAPPDVLEGKGDVKKWTEYGVDKVAIGVGKQAAENAILTTALAAGEEIAESIATGQDVNVGEVVERAVTTGVDTGVKAAVAGSLQIASETGKIGILPKGTPVKVIANIAYSAVEKIKTAFKVATGKMTVTEGMERNQDITVAQLADVAVKGIKTGVKAVATAVFGPVGAAVSTVVTEVVSHVAGDKVKKAVHEGVKKIADKANTAVKKFGEKVIDTGKKVVSKAKEVRGKIGGFFRGLFG